MKAYIFMSHPLSSEQFADLKDKGCEEIIVAQDLFPSTMISKIPAAAGTTVRNVISKEIAFLESSLSKGDIVLAQGEFGVTALLIQVARKFGAIPVYATTARTSKEVMQEDGTVLKTSVFKHVTFREYEIY